MGEQQNIEWSQQPGDGRARGPSILEKLTGTATPKVANEDRALPTTAVVPAPADRAVAARPDSTSEVEMLAQRQLQVEAMTGIPVQLLTVFKQGDRQSIYVTREGLLYKAEKVGIRSLMHDIIHRPTQEEPYFEVECKLELADGRKTNAFASAAADNVKLPDVKRRLLEMAQTRSQRRALHQLLGAGFAVAEMHSSTKPDFRNPNGTDVMATPEQVGEVTKLLDNPRTKALVQRFMVENGFGSTEALTFDAAEALLERMEPASFVG